MGCNSSITLAGIDARCEKSIGGVKKVYVLLASDTNMPVVDKETGTATITIGENEAWKMYQFRPNTASYTTTATFNEQGGVYFTSEVSMVFGKMDTEKRMEINALGQASLRVVVLDANNEYWVLGTEFEAQASAIAGQTGTAFSDANNYTVTLQAISLDAPYSADATLKTALQAVN